MSLKNDLRNKAKFLWIKGMKAIGNTAASIANNTRYKVDEVTIQNRRREVLNDLAHKTYALWLKGESFPEQMEKLLTELKKLDEQLNDIRAEKYAMTNKSEQDHETDTDLEASDETEDPEDKESQAMENSPVSAEINDLFDSVPSIGRSAEKVNTTLNQMSERIRNFTHGADNNEQT